MLTLHMKDVKFSPLRKYFCPSILRNIIKVDFRIQGIFRTFCKSGVPGQCNQDGVVYQATVTSATCSEETYVGLATNVKKR